MNKTPGDPHDFLRATQFNSKVAWEQERGTSLHVDPELKGRHGTIYRYVTPLEADALLRARRWRFDHPTTWSDKYEAYIADHLFDQRKTAESPLGGAAPFNALAIYAKCFTLHYASEALWRLNKSKIRLTFTLGGLIRSLATARCDDGSPAPSIYIGRARYMDPWTIRDAIQDLRLQDPKKVSGMAVPALLMKRVGFHFENEIRVCVAWKPNERKQDFVELTVEHHGIGEVMINPYERELAAQGLLLKYGDMGIPVARSKFNLDPLSI